MAWLQNWTLFVISCCVLIGAVLWGVADGGYEPWLLFLGTVAAILAGQRFIPWRSDRRTLTPEQKIAARDKWRPIFEDYFLELARHDQKTDVIVHDVKRLDNYPDTEEKGKGISSWFRVGLMGTYHRGVLLGLQWTYLEQKNGRWVEVRTKNTAKKVMLLGEVPYEAIESVNFEGDPYYNKPHIWCHFDYKGQPYARMYYGEEFQLDPKFPYHYTEIVGYKPSLMQRLKYWLCG